MTFDAGVYYALEDLTERMASAAEAQDIEMLTSLSDDYAALCMRLEDIGQASPDELKKLSEAIEHILSNQCRIAEHAAPWLEDVRKLLRDSRQERHLIDAYRSST